MTLLIGSGRVAKHITAYHRLLGRPLRLWSRKDSAALSLEGITHVLLAVTDEALPTFESSLSDRVRIVHFSGATTLPWAAMAHPLMTFSDRLLDLATYRQIPFAVEPGQSLPDLIPGFANPFFAVEPTKRALYHALSSLASNATFVHLRSVAYLLRGELGLDPAWLGPLLHQTIENVVTDPEHGLTGPLTRNDWDVVRRHLNALDSHGEAQRAYRLYLETARHQGVAIPEALT